MCIRDSFRAKFTNACGLTVYSSPFRLYYKNSKSDLQYLYNPIELACQTFLSKEPKIKDLFICAQKGIDRLINTYKSCSIICHSLYFYSSLIGNYLNTNFIFFKT